MEAGWLADLGGEGQRILSALFRKLLNRMIRKGTVDGLVLELGD